MTDEVPQCAHCPDISDCAFNTTIRMLIALIDQRDGYGCRMYWNEEADGQEAPLPTRKNSPQLYR